MFGSHSRLRSLGCRYRKGIAIAVSTTQSESQCYPAILKAKDLDCCSQSQSLRNGYRLYRTKTMPAKGKEEEFFTVSYLVNKCGLSSESALSASKNLYFQTSHKPDSVLSLLRSYGLSEPQLHQVIRKFPQLLAFDPGNCLQPKLDFFISKGLSNSELALMIMCSPYFLARSLHNFLIPLFDLVKDLVPCNERKAILILRNQLMTKTSHDRVKENVKVLLDIGVPKPNAAVLLLNWPIGSCNLSTFRRGAAQVMEFGFDPLKVSFVRALHVVLGMCQSKRTRKMEIYKKWGWSEETTLAAFRKQPLMMMVSEKKIEAVMDVWVNQFGFSALLLARNPMILSLSLERRIKPRAAVLKFLLSEGIIEDNTKLSTPFAVSENCFLQKYVNSFKEPAPSLIKLYEETLNLSQDSK